MELVLLYIYTGICHIGKGAYQLLHDVQSKIISPAFKVIKDIISSILYDREGYVSRKLVAAWILTGLITLLTTGHIVAYHALSFETEQLIESSDFVTFLEIIWATYFGSNVAKSIVAMRKNNSQETGGDDEIPG